MAKRQRNIVNDTQKSNLCRPHGKTPRQKAYIEALEHDPQIIALGPAGTGKTFLAASMAAFLYLRGKVENIILTRPAVEVGERHGFLPGDLQKKVAPWALPMVEVLEDCLGKQAVLEMMKTGELRFETFAYMRGRTYRNAFVFLDEAQNTTPKQIEMFLTRLGEDSRVVINGDLRQCDLPDKSGLALALELIRKHGIPATVIEFSAADVQRSGLCKLWVEAFAAEQQRLAA